MLVYDVYYPGCDRPVPNTLEEAIADWCRDCQNTGMLRDLMTETLRICDKCDRIAGLD